MPNGGGTYGLVWRSAPDGEARGVPVFYNELVYVGAGRSALRRLHLLLRAIRRCFDSSGMGEQPYGERHGVDDWAARLDRPPKIEELFVIVIFNDTPHDVEWEILRDYHTVIGGLPPANRHRRIKRWAAKGAPRCTAVEAAEIVSGLICRSE